MRRSKLTNFLTKDMLIYEYDVCGSMQKMADKLGVSIDSIYKYMQLFEIPYAPHFKRIYTCNDDIFKFENEKTFYLVGFIAADGSLQKRKYSKILKLTLSKKDIEHLEKIKELLESNHPIKEYKVKPNKLISTSNDCVELQIVSNNIFDDLTRFNIVPNKTKIYEFPKWLIDHPLVNHFMRGYFDGDGSISYCIIDKNRTIRQKRFNMIGNENFIYNYRDILIKNCNISKVKISPKGTIFSVSYCGNGNAQKIYNFLYKDATIYLERKYQKFIS